MRAVKIEALGAVLCILLCVALPAIVLNRCTDKRLSYEQLDVYLHETNESVTMSLEEYTAHICAFYTTEEWHKQALEALAVAMRTRALLYKGTECGHDFCDSTEHSMPYNPVYDEKVRSAVESTAGKVLVYSGALAPAFVHHSSYLVTESAYNLTGEEVSCIVSVSSPEIVEGVSRFVHMDEITLVMQAKLGFEDFCFDDDINIICNSTGRVSQISVKAKAVSGEDFAKAFGLPSTHIMLEKENDGYTVTTHGEGSGLGMSLCGAQQMASQSITYDEILYHYYPGCEIIPVYTMLK